MSETVFTKVDYDLASLVKYIELGQIGLPDIQRPFVWKNTKVRDLFDSMYRGYPVGYLLLWQNGMAYDRTIGTDKKQKSPQLVIVDGQQRLTALYAVVKGVPVVRENYESEKISIAFNPLEGRFEVFDAAIQRDKAFIPDISRIWSSGTNIFKIASDYLNGLQASREVSDEEIEKIQNAITKLQSLMTFPFTALELAADVSEEDVSEVFVRINSKGTPLNQADFILTLMSVFWDEGRAELERFCREARKPSKGKASPFNYFIEPDPDQLLRVAVGIAFKRARLKYVYSILRGKDLETGQFSEERRIAQFELLKDAQRRTLNLQYWHDFLNCIRVAGFRSAKMISSQTNLLFSYMLYLMGRTEYGVEEFTLRKAIAQWFFMSAVTGRFTGSPESAMEFDLARLRDVKTPEQFLAKLQQVCDIALPNDFWDATLPNDLATSSPRSPSLFAYNASQILLDAKVLLSNTKVADLLDPAIHPRRGPIERHHLFPKDYLATLKITATRDTNQIANYAYVEWGDNSKISNYSPAKYLPQLRTRFSDAELARMYHHHALPENWEQMEYNAFLEQRREMMAQVIREGYQTLIEGPASQVVQEEFDLAAVLSNGENDAAEFKSTLRTNLHTGAADKRMELAVLKTLAGFLNTGGGTLIIGASDDGTPVGIKTDGFPSEDKMSLHLVNIVKDRMGPEAMTAMNIHFDDHEDNRVMVIRCKRSSSPVYVKDDTIERFYIRTGPSTTELTLSQAQSYIKQRFNL
ncbi:MAG: GmrSD restriction endonuclease domain-containing protein [Methanothrix sp.]